MSAYVPPGAAIAATQALRNLIWSFGYRPMPVYSPDHADQAQRGKAPLGQKWQERARQDPPECIRLATPVAWALNTGLLCDGLRAIDLDIDDAAIVAAVRERCTSLLGTTIVRTRPNSPRCLLVYRASEGEPGKLVLAGSLGKIEVLGRGQQFVAYGGHPSGAELQWLAGGPADHALANCPAVTEEQIRTFLNAAAPLIEAQPPPRTNGNGHDHTPGDPQADPLRIAVALQAIPNAGPEDWEWWNKVGMAVWRATGGSNLGWEALSHWSQRNKAYSAKETRERWDHYSISQPNQIGAGTLFWMAQEARARQQEPPPGPSGRLTLAFGPDAAIAPPDQSTVVRGLFHKGSITLISGLPKSGKSFLATNAALAVADPDIGEWMGHRIQQHGPVLYVACEGHGGFWKRLQAAGHVPEQFALATGRPMLVANPDLKGYAWVPYPNDIKAAVAGVQARYGTPPILVIIDTVFRSFGGGNVNDSSHMNAYVAAAQEIADAGCAICLVHHTTKAGNSPAGSVSLMGGADTLVSVVKNKDGSHQWQVDEAKDDASGEAVGFKLEVVNGIVDASDEEVSSCVLVPADAQPSLAPGRPPNKQRIDQVLAILKAILPSDHGRVTITVWRDAVFSQTMPGEAYNTKWRAFSRDRDKLLAQGRVVATGDMVTVP